MPAARQRPPRGRVTTGSSDKEVELSLGNVAIYVVGALLVGAFVVWRFQSVSGPEPTSTEDLGRVADLAPFKTVNRVEDGWIMVLSPDWTGVNDPGVVKALCAKLTARLSPMEGQTIDLLRGDGEPLRNCQASK